MSPKKMTITEFQALPKEEREKILGKSTRAAIKRIHDAGLPSVDGDDEGACYLCTQGGFIPDQVILIHLRVAA